MKPLSLLTILVIVFVLFKSFYVANFGSSSLKNDERMPLMPPFTSPPVLVVARF